MKPFKLSELRRRMVYIAEQTLATPKGGEAFEALQCEIANVVAERDARIAELEEALVYAYNRDWDDGSGLSGPGKVQFLIEVSK